MRLPAGSNPPEWSWPLITNSAAWAVAPSIEEQPPVDEEWVPPPMHGKGSSRDAWASYATDRGVTVTDGASRADIIAALDDANIRTK